MATWLSGTSNSTEIVGLRPQLFFDNLLNIISVEFLGSCVSPREDGDSLTPSWVLDWNHFSFMAPLHRTLTVTDPSSISPYAACGPFSGELSFTLHPPPYPKYLLVDGLRIAKIVKVLDAVTATYPDLTMERSWETQFEADKTYCLTGESLQKIYERTIVADVQPTDKIGHVKRGGEADWEAGTQQKINQIKEVTTQRRVLFAGSGQGEEADHSTLLLGIGRDDIQVGDELWALKGGSLLYVLRREGQLANVNLGPPEEVGQDRESLLCLSTTRHAWDERLFGDCFSFRGEVSGSEIDMNQKQIDLASRLRG